MYEFLEGLNWPGITNETVVKTIAAVITAVVAIVAILAIHFLARTLVDKLVLRLVSKTKTRWDDMLKEAKFFRRLARIVPALVLYVSAERLFQGAPEFAVVIVEQGSLAFMVLVATLTVSALLEGTVRIYETYEIARDRPIRSFVQVAKIVVYILGFILILCALMDRSPMYFLGGFGAMTAILMLVFKDSILGFVASIQLATQNMVRIGDWVEVPKYGVDGEVREITLTTIKVQNWDKTNSTLPTYALMSDSFKNWRGMSESGGRRIKRSFFIDMNSVKFCEEAMLERFSRIQYLADYIAERREEIAEYNRTSDIDTEVLVNGRRMTNLGTFRHYVLSYLKNHPKINQDLTLIVRQLQPTSHGLPIEIYAFSSDQAWANYEAIQADIFDHVLAVVPEFDLRIFQHPSDSSLAALKETDW